MKNKKASCSTGHGTGVIQEVSLKQPLLRSKAHIKFRGRTKYKKRAELIEKLIQEQSANASS